MIKKLLIAAVAIIAGTVVLTKVTKISPAVWFGDCCHSARSMVPPEMQLRQLKTEIGNIDRDINKNLSRLARMDVEVKMFEEQLDAKRDRQAKLRTDIGDMGKSLEGRTEKVAYRGHKLRSSDLTRRLDRHVNEFNCLKEQVKAHEQLLASKKRTLEVAKNRISEMKKEKENLTLLAARLETHLEIVKMKQMENQVIDFDNSAVSQARQTAKDVEVRLRTAETKMKLDTEFGYANKSALEAEAKSTDEVLKAARQALEDDNELVGIDKNEK